MEIGGAEIFAVVPLDEGWAPLAGIVASLLALNLHHIRAEVRQQLAAPWPGENAGKFEDTDLGEGCRARGQDRISGNDWASASGRLSHA